MEKEVDCLAEGDNLVDGSKLAAKQVQLEDTLADVGDRWRIAQTILFDSTVAS